MDCISCRRMGHGDDIFTTDTIADARIEIHPVCRYHVLEQSSMIPNHADGNQSVVLMYSSTLPKPGIVMPSCESIRHVYTHHVCAADVSA